MVACSGAPDVEYGIKVLTSTGFDLREDDDRALQSLESVNRRAEYLATGGRPLFGQQEVAQRSKLSQITAPSPPRCEHHDILRRHVSLQNQLI